jgi:small subunit ribosomal protein S17
MEEKNEIKNEEVTENTEEVSEANAEETPTETQETSTVADAPVSETEEKVEEKSNENATAGKEEEKEEKIPHKRILTGKVKSNKPDKTIIVAVEAQVMHPLYKKYYKKTKKFMAHDAENNCNEGDTVRIKEHRALSAKKRWILDKIVERAK